MTFQEAIRTCFEKYTVFSGRARRSEFWWWILFIAVVNLVLGGLDNALFGTGGLQLLGIAFGLATLLPTLAVAARRLHDRDMSPWWLLLWLLPGVGFLVVLLICAFEGTKGANRYGPEPGVASP